MSTVIKGGTIVAADRTYEADILIEGETIAAIGENLKGGAVIDAEGAYIMPGGIDPHTHLEMPFMGTTAAETWESGTFAAVSGGTTLVVDFVIPGPDGMLAALDDWEGKAKRQASSDYSLHMCVNGWSKKHFDEMPKVIERGINTFKHFMAYKGALMVTTTRCSPRSSAARPLARCRWSMPRMATSSLPCRKNTCTKACPAPRPMRIRVRRKSRAKRPTAPS
jgi:dihydropyrimidinase